MIPCNCPLPRTSGRPDGEIWTCKCGRMYRLHPVVRRWFRYPKPPPPAERPTLL